MDSTPALLLLHAFHFNFNKLRPELKNTGQIFAQLSLNTSLVVPNISTQHPQPPPQAQQATG